MHHRRAILRLAGLGGAGLLLGRTAQAEPVVFQKKIGLYIGYTPGGSYDLYGRLVARHLGRFLPGQPTVVPQNMPGAGSLNAANYVYNIAPKDGTALGVVVETLALEQNLGNPAVQYDARRFTWIGRVASSNNVQLVWHTSKVQSFEDAKHIEAAMAGSPGNIGELVPRLLNSVVGTKFKVIAGYPASAEGMLAMERGEVDGTTTSWAALKSTKQDWLKEKKIRIILQDLPERSAELPDVPCLVELGQNPADRELLSLYASGGVVGRSILAPPGLPAEITRALRDGFMAMTGDPAFIAELTKANVDLDPLAGEQLERVVAESLHISEDVRQRANTLLRR
jgi:tripartite-type tricarboxylate transporter receptor subunit TctC